MDMELFMKKIRLGQLMQSISKLILQINLDQGKSEALGGGGGGANEDHAAIIEEFRALTYEKLCLIDEIFHNSL
jgi:hypothetical protein